MNLFSKKHPGDTESWHIPPLGQRILKTGIAVFLCLLIYAFRGYKGSEMRAEAAITAIICIQPYVSSTREYAVNRITGFLIGAGWGLLLLLLLYRFPILGTVHPVLYALMAAGVILSLYTSVMVHKTESSALSAIIFLWLVVNYPDVEAPFLLTANKLVDLLIGILAAVLINSFHLPRTRNSNYLFFVRMKDLVPDRFSNISPNVLFRLNALYSNSARICLISEHAPAFFTLQMNAVRPTAPSIVMDGAAIYQPDTNTFLHKETIPFEDASAVIHYLGALPISFFIYTIHRDRTRIFHHGEMREEESAIYARMRKSPYRDYFEGEIYDPHEIVFLKIIIKKDRTDTLKRSLHPILSSDRIRCETRIQAGAEGLSALYFYSARATVEEAKRQLVHMLQDETPSLIPMDIQSPKGYRTEFDALHLLHRIERAYEPIRLPRFK